MSFDAVTNFLYLKWRRAMIIGKTSKNTSRLIDERSAKALDYAVSRIRASAVAPYVSSLYLYGSCARNEQRYASDVDLFLELNADADMELLRDKLIKLKGEISMPEPGMPDVEMKIAVGDDWRRSDMLFYRNVAADGIDIWEKN